MSDERTCEVEVRAVCPVCGSKRYVRYGQSGAMIYRLCQECDHRGVTWRVDSTAVARVEMLEPAGEKPKRGRRKVPKSGK